MESFDRPEIRVAIVSILVILIVSDYFITGTILNDYVKAIVKWATVIAGFTVVLGAANVFVVHGRRVRRRVPQWTFSVWVLFCVVLTIVLALTSDYSSAAKVAYDTLLMKIHTPLTSAAYGIIGFYFTSCCFRSFRGRNSYVVVFLLSGLIVLLSKAPIGAYIPGISSAGPWIQNIPSMAGTRGIVMGAAVGLIAAGLRGIIGAERTGLLTRE